VIGEDAGEEERSIRKRANGKQGTAKSRGLLVLPALHTAGEVQLEAAPPERPEPEGLDHANGLDAPAGHRLGRP
jgi:hypothetical protein